MSENAIGWLAGAGGSSGGGLFVDVDRSHTLIEAGTLPAGSGLPQLSRWKNAHRTLQSAAAWQISIHAARPVTQDSGVRKARYAHLIVGNPSGRTLEDGTPYGKVRRS